MQPWFERIAEQLIHYLVEKGLLHAECAEDREHPCVVIWHPSAVEQLGAYLAHEAGLWYTVDGTPLPEGAVTHWADMPAGPAGEKEERTEP